MTISATSFEVKTCELRYFGPRKTIDGRVAGVVRAHIEEHFMGNVALYPLDLKVKADVGHAASEQVRTSLLGDVTHQLNRLRARHSSNLPKAAE
ncbi:MAG: hypothetical protein MO852_16055 [Candidatus Devosia euplotis]|nr:hypothetical protein [Candidatus Devosia euplotis]